MVSEKIQAIRKHNGYSQEELARQLGVSFPTVNAWERGKSNPYPRHKKAIDDLYKVVLGETETDVILIVEDDESSALVLADYCSMALEEYETVTVTSGYDAILQIGVLKPKLILLDIMMPEIDGLKVFEKIKEMDVFKDTRIIFVTAATDEEILEKARNSGAFALLQKPVKRDEIINLLKLAVETRA
ncbi:MAG: response regulator [Lentisphaeria bacterium]|nr:response regulator [Lentisphaeria bacterium]